MGKPRSGRKAWRGIDASAVEDAHATAALRAKSGAEVATLPDDALFFVDASAAPVPARLTKRQRQEAKGPLRCDAILARNPLITYPEPLPPRPSKHLKKGGALAVPPSAPSRRAPQAARRAAAVKAGVFDVWDDTAPAAAPAAAAAAAAAKRQRPPRSKAALPPGVEVCHAGASYNPAIDAHQELLGAAVAAEHMKLLHAELHPVNPPAMGGRVAEHLMREMLFAQEDPEPEDAPRLCVGDEDDDGEGAAAARARSQKRKLTKTDRNRRARARAVEDAAAAARALKKQRRDIELLAPLAAEVTATATAAEERAARRAAAAAHRSAVAPSRLGKRRFAAEPIAVQLSEEVTGSLRRLAPVPTLLRDRYKSLQRRELVEPRAPAAYKRSRSYLQYEPGARGSREAELHAQALKEKAEAKAKAVRRRGGADDDVADDE